MPAGTGVCVVKTVPPRMASTRLGERPPLGDELADPLDPEEARVALVHVEHLGRWGSREARERAQSANAADAEQDLLEEPFVLAAAVESLGQHAKVGHVEAACSCRGAASERGRRRHARSGR